MEMTLPYDDALDNALWERSVDLARNAKAFTATALVRNGGQSTAIIRIPAGAGFAVHGLVGRALGPVNASGVRVAAPTIFPMAGSSATAGAPMADRGLIARLRLMDGRRLTNEKKHFSTLYNDAPVEDILGSAYGTGWSYISFPFRLFLEEGATLFFDLTNRDTATGLVPLYHRLDLILLGERHVRA